MSELQTVINSQMNLPSTPAIVAELSSLLSKSDVSSNELAKVAKTDQAFTARILKIVNSPFYGFSRQITSVEEAITMLGLDVVNQLLLATSVLNTLKTDSRILDINKFWLHSFGVGVFAKHLLYRKSKELKNKAFICGILHDIGRLVFLKLDADRYTAFYDQGHSVTDLDKEQKWFGLDHQQIGAELGRKWNFPEDFVLTIGNHHTPEKYAEESELVASVHLADIICHALDVGASGNKYVYSFSPEAWKNLELNRSQLKEIVVGALAEIEKTKKLLQNFS